MEPKSSRTPLVVIVGETASGKTALAIELAKQFNGEIIAADSRTVYRGMDIGTAKPSAAEQTAVPHHLLDIADPTDPLTVADFKRLAEQAIHEIAARGKVPFLVGGTGLYIDAVLYDFSFAPKADDAQRQEWQRLSVRELQTKLEEQGIPLPNNPKNSRHLIRSLETKGRAGDQRALREDTIVVGVSIDRDDLRRRIAARIDAMFTEGLVREAQDLGSRYGWEIQPMQTIGYREFKDVLNPEFHTDGIKAKIMQDTLQYAKRQRTWFRRNKSIHWIWKKEEAVELITTFLNK